MEVNRDSLIRILHDSKCEWTRGYVAAILDGRSPATSTNHQIAREIIDECLKRNQKIQAIKKVREQYGIGLKEAKDVVDEYQSSGQIVFPKGFRFPDDDDDASSAIPF